MTWLSSASARSSQTEVAQRVLPRGGVDLRVRVLGGLRQRLGEVREARVLSLQGLLRLLAAPEMLLQDAEGVVGALAEAGVGEDRLGEPRHVLAVVGRALRVVVARVVEACGEPLAHLPALRGRQEGVRVAEEVRRDAPVPPRGPDRHARGGRLRPRRRVGDRRRGQQDALEPPGVVERQGRRAFAQEGGGLRRGGDRRAGDVARAQPVGGRDEVEGGGVAQRRPRAASAAFRLRASARMVVLSTVLLMDGLRARGVDRTRGPAGGARCPRTVR